MLFGRIVPPNSVLFGRTVPQNSVLFGGTVPPNSVIFGVTVPPNSFPQYNKVDLIYQYTGTPMCPMNRGGMSA